MFSGVCRSELISATRLCVCTLLGLAIIPWRFFFDVSRAGRVELVRTTGACVYVLALPVVLLTCRCIREVRRGGVIRATRVCVRGYTCLSWLLFCERLDASSGSVEVRLLGPPRYVPSRTCAGCYLCPFDVSSGLSNRGHKDHSAVC